MKNKHLKRKRQKKLLVVRMPVDDRGWFIWKPEEVIIFRDGLSEYLGDNYKIVMCGSDIDILVNNKVQGIQVNLIEEKDFKDFIKEFKNGKEDVVDNQNKIMELLNYNNLDYEGLKKLFDDYKGLQREVQLYSRAFLRAIDVIAQSNARQVRDTLLAQAEEDLTKNK